MKYYYDIVLELKSIIEKLEKIESPVKFLILEDSKYKKFKKIARKYDNFNYEGLFIRYKGYNIIPKNKILDISRIIDN